MGSSFLLILAAAFLQLATSSPFPIINTSYGAVRGYTYTAQDGTESLIFKKIPFASAPVGDLRWKKPQPPKPWNETLDNTFFGPACAQRTVMYEGPITGFSEDCLHLNVYTSQKCLESNSACPVVFVIHGGSGLYGSTMKYPDETTTSNFVAQGIIFVTIAYRLGPFGALFFGDENALPANLGMHDIIAALKFTRNEIGNFGGDKEHITLMGHSSGAQYALMIAFSPGISTPGEKRLFDGVISMSGTSYLEQQEDSVQRSQAVAKELGCEGSAREIMHCFQAIDTETILEKSFKVHGIFVISGKGPYGITMAGELFPITNAKELREGNDPTRLMIGSTIYELGPNSGENLMNRVLGIENNEECYEKYRRDTLSGDFVPGFAEASQDIVMSAHMFAKHQAEIGGEAFLYEYDYTVHGNHTDDAFFVFGFHPFKMDENEKWMSRVYHLYFTNFIKGERLAKDWSPVESSLMNYYSVIRNISDEEFPHTKIGYQHNIVAYYDDLVKYDDMITLAKITVLNAPVEYKSLNVTGNFQDFLDSLTFVDVLIIICFSIGVICFLCCLCKCFSRIFCCCCRKSRGCEHEPLLMNQYR